MIKHLVVFAITDDDNVEELTWAGVIQHKLAGGEYIEITNCHLDDVKGISVTGLLQKNEY
jgi:hypothetical protein